MIDKLLLSANFLGNEYQHLQPSNQPANLWHAINSIHGWTHDDFAKDIFYCESDNLTSKMIYDKIIETNKISKIDDVFYVCVGGDYNLKVFYKEKSNDKE